MQQSIVITATRELSEREISPITPNWILAGKPEARAQLLAKSHDGFAYMMQWECTAGHFNWHYTEDETVIVLSGEVFISQNGEERRLGAHDMAHFPAGSSCTWRVPDRITKIAIMRKPLPFWIGLAVRAWNKLTRVVGLEAKGSPLMSATRRS
jgi:uncharacterized cupin superfamily protein